MLNFQWGLMLACKWVFDVGFRCIVDLGYINVVKDTSISIWHSALSVIDRCLWSFFIGYIYFWVCLGKKKSCVANFCARRINTWQFLQNLGRFFIPNIWSLWLQCTCQIIFHCSDVPLSCDFSHWSLWHGNVWWKITLKSKSFWWSWLLDIYITDYHSYHLTHLLWGVSFVKLCLSVDYTCLQGE